MKSKGWRFEVGKRSGRLNRQRAINVKSYLMTLKKTRRHFDYFENKNEKLKHLCLNCGDHLGNICQTHHINPNKRSSPKNKIILCASCHRITYAAIIKRDANKQLKKRGKLFSKNLKRR